MILKEHYVQQTALLLVLPLFLAPLSLKWKYCVTLPVFWQAHGAGAAFAEIVVALQQNLFHYVSSHHLRLQQHHPQWFEIHQARYEIGRDPQKVFSLIAHHYLNTKARLLNEFLVS
ncbi:hypothetical protein V8G54_016117 [Vigna mungo]|uniref:Uncharacterized protein n=1 Tax=Vigna mungo TaxID=3915 RepID=A0AAQ3NNF2_VIGMU